MKTHTILLTASGALIFALAINYLFSHTMAQSPTMHYQVTHETTMTRVTESHDKELLNIQTMLDKLTVRLKDLEEKSEAAGRAGEKTLQQNVAELRSQLSAAEIELQRLRSQSGETYADLKVRLQIALDKLNRSFAKTEQEFRS